MFNFSGKTVLITGASGGIGAAAARAFYQLGAQVILHGTNINKLEQLQNELSQNALSQNDSEGRSFCVAANLANRQEVSTLIKTATEIAAPIDILINNAGITRDNLLMRMKDDDWDQVFEVNLRASMVLCRDVLRSMMKAKWGRIISISSIVGATGNAGQTNYAAAKAGILGFTKALALETARKGITVNAICPGYIETDMTSAIKPEVLDAIVQQIPTGRMGRPEEIAALVGFLASEKAAFITGATLDANGGQYMA